MANADSSPELEPIESEPIEETECWRLLASRPVGRVAINVGDYPLVFPVNHAVVAHGVVFRTAPGSKLWSTRRSRVSFEVDDFDPVSQTGWSVVVRGSAREITAENTNQELFDIVEAGAPLPWAPGPREHLVRVVADAITGRRIGRTQAQGTSQGRDASFRLQPANELR